MQARKIEVSEAAAAIDPALATAIAAAGGRPVRVVADGEAGGDVVVGRSALPSVGTDGSRLRLAFDHDGTVFAAALIAAATRGDVPAGREPVSTALTDLAAKVAARDVGVLVAGPTGTGKEVLARFIHARSPRRAGPFVAVNCAAIPETMLEATLFGYERGAFTGATTSSPGLFRAAGGGTLLLDEVGELPLALQAKLLRVLQEREVLPVGATGAVAVDARIIATANRDLPADVAAGRFRADLFYRLAVMTLTTTPLATRPGDIVPIAAALWLRQQIAAWPTPAALAKLTRHSWPGNVRELGNVIARAAILADGNRVGADDITFDPVPFADPLTAASASLGGSVRAHEFATIRSTLAACAGRRQAAAQLGISERTLRYKLAAMAGSPGAMTVQ